MSEQWHMPPWQIEREAPALWVDRWREWQIARNGDTEV